MPSDQRLDDVRGIVIGGDYVAWQVVYDDRPQTGKHYAADDEQAMAAARAEIARLKAEWCGWPCYLYQEEKWTVRLWS